jgi:dihydrofolate synthase/folylpolyglutamate synthase
VFLNDRLFRKSNSRSPAMRNYSEALAYLNQFISYERTQPAHYSPETLSLDRVNQLLERLGRPDRSFRSIHIAGTKGKGSTAAMIESSLRAAGYRTGLYTSPHLHTFRERIRIDNENITQEDFAASVDTLEPHITAVEGLTWFEIVTAQAFTQFAKSKIDVAVLEVGLGGRFDATNVVTPIVSVITSLSLDHMNLLGNTLEQIAFEKAGIIKPRVPIVSAPQRLEAFDVIRRVARLRAAPLTLVGRDVIFERLSASLEGQGFQIVDVPAGISPSGRDADHDPPRACTFKIPLLGSHQIANAAVAITALRIANEHGLLIGDDAIRRGLFNVKWPGRLEIVNREPLVVVDGAHNGDSAQKLATALPEVFGIDDWTVIIGISADKDLSTILDALVPIASHIIVTRAHNVRAADVESLAALVSDRGQQPIVTSNVDEAIVIALRHPSPIIITGSLFTVADAREAWAARSGVPLEKDE